ncbi:MAG: hypothetical protein Q9225_004488 [Loekoesia sp. 1 TL-2023]
MPRSHAKAITQSQWEKFKEPLYQYWMIEKKPMKSRDGSREGIIDTMEDHHQFFATENQYSVQFKKKWAWNRNQQSEDWRAVAYVIHKYMRENREWEVYKDGVSYNPEKVVAKIAPWKTEVSYSTPTLQLPPNIAVRPLSSSQASLVTNLPFRIIETGLLGHFSQASPDLHNLLFKTDLRNNYHGSSASNNESHASTTAGRRNNLNVADNQVSSITYGPLFSDGYTIDALDAIVPESIAESHISDGAISGPNAPAVASPLYRKILYSVANNFAGLEAVPMVKVIQYLQAETDQKLYYLLSSIGGHSARAIAQNIFKGAIESGDHRIVNTLLDERPGDIDLNKQFLYVDGWDWTPIERAVSLRHTGVVKVLLKHQADVNRTHRNSRWPNGALDCAVHNYHCDCCFQINPNLEICDLILNAGGYLSPSTVRHMLETSKNSDVAYSIILNNAKNSVAEWNMLGVFRAAIMSLDEQRSIELINFMRELNADLNYHMRDQREKTYPPRIIDVASKRGSLQLVRLLRSLDVVLTDDTLPCAVTSGNEELVRTLLFEMDADACSLGDLGITPLAAAIRLQNPEIFALLKQHGAIDALSDPRHAQSALKAASEVGDIHFIESLIRFGTQVTPEDLGYALVFAVIDGREKVARALIDAGADTNIGTSRGHPYPEPPYRDYGPPLFETLKRRQSPDPAQALLDGDANPNYHEDSTNNATELQETSLQLAVKGGDANVAKILIDAGADPNAIAKWVRCDAPLTLAVGCRRKDLFSLLLKAGAELNNPKARISGRTALWAASKNKDLEMVRKLLELGADPQDQEAIQAASESATKEVLDLIIEKHSERYRHDYSGIGSTMLKLAIGNRDAQKISRLLQRGANPTIISHGTRHGLVNSLGYAILEDKRSSTRVLDLFFSQRRYDPDSIVFTSFEERSRAGAWPRMTALLLAVKIQDVTTIESLIRYGANVNLPARGAVKRTPLQQASEVGNIQIFELLIRYGAEVNAPPADRRGATALQLAAAKGYARIVQLLLSQGTVVDAPGSKTNGLSALECASQNGRLDVVQILLNAGAGSKIGNAGQVRSSMSLAKSSGHFPISDLLAGHLEAQNWRDVPQPVEHEEPNLSIDVRSEKSEAPRLLFRTTFNLNIPGDFNHPPNFNYPPGFTHSLVFNNILDSSNALDFNEPLGFNEQMLLDDGTFQNQPLVSGYNDDLSNDNEIPSFEDLWSLTTDL